MQDKIFFTGAAKVSAAMENGHGENCDGPGGVYLILNAERNDDVTRLPMYMLLGIILLKNGKFD
jgi:hypothetical protein